TCVYRKLHLYRGTGRAIVPLRRAANGGDGNERTCDEASSRRERSETADGVTWAMEKGSGNLKPLKREHTRRSRSRIRLGLRRGRRHFFAGSLSCCMSEASIRSPRRRGRAGSVACRGPVAVVTLMTRSNLVRPLDRNVAWLRSVQYFVHKIAGALHRQ